MKTQEDLVAIHTALKENAKKIYFNAGRYMAGDRDRLATQDYFRYTVIEAAALAEEEQLALKGN